MICEACLGPHPNLWWRFLADNNLWYVKPSIVDVSHRPKYTFELSINSSVATQVWIVFRDVMETSMMIIFAKYRSSHQRCSIKKCVLRNFTKFTGKHLRQSLFFNEVTGQACNYIKKETLAQVFSCEFWEIYKSTFFTEHLWTTASGNSLRNRHLLSWIKEITKKKFFFCGGGGGFTTCYIWSYALFS